MYREKGYFFFVSNATWYMAIQFYVFSSFVVTCYTIGFQFIEIAIISIKLILKRKTTARKKNYIFPIKLIPILIPFLIPFRSSREKSLLRIFDF